MCVSPHEMTNDQLEKEILALRGYCEDERFKQYFDYYERRIEMLEKLLKERAETGTYADH
jgi:hypothetical protein